MMYTTSCEFIPSRLEWEMYDGNLDLYKEALYKVFKRDFIDSVPKFRGKSVDIIHQQFFENKERSFWHIISSGEDDINRTIDKNRCGSIPWVRALIEDNENCSNYRLWVKWHDKSKKNRYYIWCVSINYTIL